MKKIQGAFKQAMRIIAKDLGLSLSQMNLWIRFDSRGNPTVIARQESINLKKIPIDSLIKAKMMGARICAKKLTHFFRCLHATFIMTNKITDARLVSLVLYPSKSEGQICLGIYLNQRAVRAFRLDQLAELAGVGKAELN